MSPCPVATSPSTWRTRSTKVTCRAASPTGPEPVIEQWAGTKGRGPRLVGTIKRAKGLECKQVLLPDVTSADVGGAPLPEDGTERERWSPRRRELYVGITRAREGLWVGLVRGSQVLSGG